MRCILVTAWQNLSNALQIKPVEGLMMDVHLFFEARVWIFKKTTRRNFISATSDEILRYDACHQD
ncbi:MAG: hypothetical protein EB015_02605 [Methylocystaceae bacterium]|nr:hypothetical protein [Methylocystaceae bacterium]